MHKQHPQTAYRKYAVLIGAIFENCDKKSRQPILKLPTSFEPIGTIHQLVCDGVKRPAWRTISANQPNHNHKIQHKCNAQQHHQKFSHTFFSHLTYFSAPIIQIGLDGMVVHPTHATKKEHGILILNVQRVRSHKGCPCTHRHAGHRRHTDRPGQYLS